MYVVEMKRKKPLNVEKIRAEYPMLAKKIHRKPIIYFDNAATGHKPQSVLERLKEFYTNEYGQPKESHFLGKNVSRFIEDARKKVVSFIGATSEKNIVFTRGCTESINIVAGGFAKGILGKNDEVVITAMEHHANIVPWQMACAQSGAILKVVPILSTGEVDLKAYSDILSDRTKIVAVVHSSHVLGTILPVKEMVKLAHRKNIPVMLDGAQAAPHIPVNMQDLDCDFYTFSAHKMGGPTGVGVLYGKRKWLEKIPPVEGGSDMAKKVSFGRTEYSDIPTRFEAGTMPFADIIAFTCLLEFLEELNMQRLFEYEEELLSYTTRQLMQIEGVTIYGTAPEKEAVISFDVDSMDVSDIGKKLSDENIFVKAGDLSAQPLMEILGVKGLVRVSFSFYNTTTEVDVFIKALKKILEK